MYMEGELVFVTKIFRNLYYCLNDQADKAIVLYLVKDLYLVDQEIGAYLLSVKEFEELVFIHSDSESIRLSYK